MKHAATALLSLALLVTVTGCPSETGGAHGHDHGSDATHDHGAGADHAHGDGHAHEAGASEGALARITEAQTGEKVGYLRLKLHDDKGDLEVWLARDADFAQPFDVPLDAPVTVTFTDKEDRTATLRVRNREKNEDEQGAANVRDGKTNYFIYPGDSGEDATWLKGADFLATVKVSFTADGKDYTTSQFVLRPHTHGAGDGHAH